MEARAGTVLWNRFHHSKTFVPCEASEKQAKRIPACDKGRVRLILREIPGWRRSHFPAGGLREERAAPERSERPSSGVSCGQGKPEAQARAGEQSYDSIVPMKVENRRAPEKGRPRHPLEGRDEQVDVSAQCHMYGTLNPGRHVKWS